MALTRRNRKIQAASRDLSTETSDGKVDINLNLKIEISLDDQGGLNVGVGESESIVVPRETLTPQPTPKTPDPASKRSGNPEDALPTELFSKPEEDLLTDFGS